VAASASPTQIDEEGSPTHTVSASSTASQDITVNYSMSGTAKLGSDYTLSGTPGKVTIPGGQASGTVTLNAASNKALKKKKTAIMTLQSGAGYKLGKSITATVTITP